MTQPLFRVDAYLRSAPGRVIDHTAEGGIVLDVSLFHPTGGGQPGDAGRLVWDGGGIDIATTVRGQGSDIVLVPAEPAPLPVIGTRVTQSLVWDRRHRLMRMHTALHLLSAVLARPVAGGHVGTEKSRLDIEMEDAMPDRIAVGRALSALIAGDLPVTAEVIGADDLAARPALIRTAVARPPRDAGDIRLIRIGTADATVDLQPCGGTHVATTAEIGQIEIGKIERKGRTHRRVYLHLAGA
ncbi:Ala-tRNA(Pro) hydrolase [Loktanella fryxellensis]|uniref:Ala-tRNA(Pro) hydrolase n=1 Tax=Loktanella fryxellensis TaxID=245187 RepID=A0A1H8I0L6_9RHOB|nr:alanyl-tRNA editing protein [Loktanella fryxellensis]SEN61761.1 Ala-tRNA(Pro) hydrolase [Loktanella fryxellensis]